MSEPEYRSELFAFADEYVEKVAELSPMSATAHGIDRYDDRLDDFSIEVEHEREAMLRSSLETLRAIEAVDDADRVAKAFMEERVSRLLGLAEGGEWRRTFSVLASPASDVRMVFELQPADTPEHAEKIRARLAAVRGALGSWRSALEEDAAAGSTAARRQSLGVAAQLATYAGTAAFEGVAQRLAESCGVDAEGAGLLAAAADADRACGELSEWMRDVYSLQASETDGVGPDRYRRWAEYSTGADLDLEEAYAWGWDDLCRINARMREIAKEVAPGAASLPEVADVLDADESRMLHGTDALLAHLKQLTQGAVSMLDGTHFDIDERIRACDARLAPEGSASAPYYMSPSEDLSRPGTTWYPTFGRDRFPIWRDVSVWYHESVPGHHLQVATSIISQERLTRFQRLEGMISGYVEGWALYAERLMEELGAFSHPADEMGYLCGQALRAARVVVDIGLHLGLPAPADVGTLGALGDFGGRVWDYESAVAFVHERAMQEADKAESEVERYLGMPGQAISYKVGERVFLRCREDARRRLGDAFDLKAWHAYALELGPLGLDPLETEMAAFGS